jgi:hypothetical protein
MTAENRKDAPQHGDARHQDGPSHAQAGYETLDAHAGATYRAGLYILGTMFLVAAVLVPMYSFLARRETRAQAPAATVIREQPAAAVPAFPKLVTAEPAVLAEFHRQEDELLNSYGWVEKDRGVARMPIAEAVRLVGQRGALPAFPAAPGTPNTPSPGTGAKGPSSAGASGAAR